MELAERGVNCLSRLSCLNWRGPATLELSMSADLVESCVEVFDVLSFGFFDGGLDGGDGGSVAVHHVDSLEDEGVVGVHG